MFSITVFADDCVPRRTAEYWEKLETASLAAGQIF
jgi:hypothetical protein